MCVGDPGEGGVLSVELRDSKSKLSSVNGIDPDGGVLVRANENENEILILDLA